MNNPIHSDTMANSSKGEDIIPLRSGSDVEESGNDGTPNETDLKTENSGDETVSLSDLSSSFQKCFRSSGEMIKKTNLVEKSPCNNNNVVGFFPQLRPFDYDSTKNNIIFGGEKPVAVGDNENREDDDGDGSVNRRQKKGGRKNNGAVTQRDERNKELAPGGRRHAFPASGNRSATFG